MVPYRTRVPAAAELPATRYDVLPARCSTLRAAGPAFGDEHVLQWTLGIAFCATPHWSQASELRTVSGVGGVELGVFLRFGQEGDHVVGWQIIESQSLDHFSDVSSSRIVLCVPNRYRLFRTVVVVGGERLVFVGLPAGDVVDV